MSILYTPPDGAAADFIPFYWKGQYHLFYLKDYRNVEKHGDGTPWFHLVTEDFVHFEDWGEAIPRGVIGSQDRWIYTGCVVEHDGLFHIFYTGNNAHYRNIGKPVQAVMHATSRDLRTWERDETFTPLLPPEGYTMHDWRDPFVFWNDEAREWWMLLAARRAERPGLRGVTALLASPDLRTWQLREPFWAPDLYYTLECPDLFRMGDWWYLVFSEFSERHTTHYRMSRSLKGPWIAPPDDDFDTRAFYAAKTAGVGNERYLFGWLASRQGDKDNGPWQWGGTLMTHRLAQRPDGTLAVSLPESVAAVFGSPLPVVPNPLSGTWQCATAAARAEPLHGRSLLALGELPQSALLDVTLTLDPGTHGAGVFLRADPCDSGFQHEVRLDLHRQRVVLDRHIRWMDTPFVLERPCALVAGRPVRVRVLLDGTCVVVYVDDTVALSGRIYEPFGARWGMFVDDGGARVAQVAVTVRG